MLKQLERTLGRAPRIRALPVTRVAFDLAAGEVPEGWDANAYVGEVVRCLRQRYGLPADRVTVRLTSRRCSSCSVETGGEGTRAAELVYALGRQLSGRGAV